MALVVEDGTGLSNANALVSVAVADARHALLGNTAWAALATPAREAAIARATAYMGQAYRTRWSGRRTHMAQRLDWPRYAVCIDGYPVPTDQVPEDVANACADLALRASTDDLNADLSRAVVREKVGPIETEYDRNSPQATRFRAVDMALAPYLRGSSAMATLVRA